MHKSPKLLKLMSALAIALQTGCPVFADSSYSLSLAECPGTKQLADADLINRNGRLVTALKIVNDVSEYRELSKQARAGFEINTLPNNFKPSLFNTKKTEFVFEFDTNTNERGMAMVFRYKNQVGTDKFVLFSSNPADKDVFKLVKNQDGSYTGTIKSGPMVAHGIPANADITFAAFVYQPTIPKKTRSNIYVRSVEFLDEDASPSIKAGVGGCERLGNAGSFAGF